MDYIRSPIVLNMLKKIISEIAINFVCFFVFYLVFNYKKLDLDFVKAVISGWKILVILFFSVFVMFVDMFFTKKKGKYKT